MESLQSLLFDIGPYHWLALAAALIAIEMVMPTQYLMWPGIAAGVVGLLGFAIDLALPAEIGIFAALSGVLVGVSHFYLPKVRLGAGSGLNQRTDQLVGTIAFVSEDFKYGKGSVTVGDTRWSAQAIDGGDYAAGTKVQIVSADSTLLTVKSS